MSNVTEILGEEFVVSAKDLVDWIEFKLNENDKNLTWAERCAYYGLIVKIDEIKIKVEE